MAEQIAPRLRMIENDVLTDYLRSLGNRLVQHLPATNLNFRFYLIDLPEPNAFSIAGGRVYVSRKLIAMTRSEDELAGIIAHELGPHSDAPNGNLHDPALSRSPGRD